MFVGWKNDTPIVWWWWCKRGGIGVREGVSVREEGVIICMYWLSYLLVV
jgi:hypothetical protein